MFFHFTPFLRSISARRRPFAPSSSSPTVVLRCILPLLLHGLSRRSILLSLSPLTLCSFYHLYPHHGVNADAHTCVGLPVSLLISASTCVCVCVSAPFFSRIVCLFVASPALLRFVVRPTLSSLFVLLLHRAEEERGIRKAPSFKVAMSRSFSSSVPIYIYV